MMKQYLIHHFYKFAVLSVILLGLSLNPIASAQENPSEIYEFDITEEMEVLETGPVHEAFAETSSPDAEPGIVVPTPPPDPINEVPPDREDLEEGAQWISGYWAWDDDRNDYIWISGTWRVPPPGREWVPGNWVERKQGFQWVSGYWADSQIEEAEYLPKPPKSIEEGPNMDAPSPDYAWVPGSWVWLHGNYGWRPGYWTRMRPDWVWVPAYYAWTPRGYIFAGGYWDFAIARRGVLFAPVYFYPRFFTRVFFPFTPGFVIGLNVFSDCIFVRPVYRHYYFGNYYASKYYKRGIYPWFSRHARPHGYDPIYAHQRYKHRNNRTWEKDMHAKFNGRRDLEDKGPQTIEHGKKNDRRAGKPIVKNEGTTLSRKQVEKNKDIVLREYNIKKDDRRKKVDQKNVVKENRRPRKAPDADTVDQSSRESVKGPKPIKTKSSRNAVASKKVNEYDNKTSSYENHTAPKSNPVVNPVQKPSTDPRLKNRNHRTLRPNPEVMPVQKPSTDPRLKNRNHKASRPNPETAPVQETSNEPILGNRNRRQISRDQEQEIIDQSREDRGLNSVNQGNRPATSGQKAYGQGRYSDDGRRYMDNRQRMYNGRR